MSEPDWLTQELHKAEREYQALPESARPIVIPPAGTDWPLHHPEGCAFCPAELAGLQRDRNGDPLCQTCPHLR